MQNIDLIEQSKNNALFTKNNISLEMHPASPS